MVISLSSAAGKPALSSTAEVDQSGSPPPPPPAATTTAASADPPSSASKKKRKKRKKPKTAGTGADQDDDDDDDAVLAKAALEAKAQAGARPAKAPPVQPARPASSLCISRNKHWRHISAYHGPWLQLPVELLESLLALNLDPLSLAPLPSSLRSSSHFLPHAAAGALPAPSAVQAITAGPAAAAGSASSSSSSSSALALSAAPGPSAGAASVPPAMPLSKLLGTGKERASAPTPPPIDPGVFRSIISIRRLVDEASDLAIRASSGLTAFNLSALSAQSLNAIEPPKGENGRPASMNATRTHRLRVLACQRLAEAYKWDEVACSVMVMQGATALDDLAEKVLRVDSENIDALYVNFFHEKIPSRMVAENTTTAVLDHLISRAPDRLEFFRTRGIVRMFLDQFTLAAKDFTHALLESRAERKRRTPGKSGKKKARSKGKGKARAGGGGGSVTPPYAGATSSNGHAASFEDNCTDVAIHRPVGPSPFAAVASDDRPQHPSARPEAPLPMEPQCLFLRASSYFTHAVWLIEGAALGIEGVRRNGTNDGVEVRLCNIPGGRFGGVENGHTEGPLGSKQGEKYRIYRAEYVRDKWKTEVHVLARKAIRDHERFVAHFDQMDSTCIHAAPDGVAPAAAGSAGEHQHAADGSCGAPDAHKGGHSHTQTFTTYHPLLVESHYCILLCHLLLGDIAAASDAYLRTTHLVDGVEGYPVFLPARSMAQAEFLEVFERLATWRYAFAPRGNAAGTKTILPAAPPTIVEPTAETAVSGTNGSESSHSGLSHPVPLAASGSSLSSVTPDYGASGSSSSSSFAGPSCASSSTSSHVGEAGGSGSGRQTPVSYAGSSNSAGQSSASPTQTTFAVTDAQQAEVIEPPKPPAPFDDPARHLDAARSMVIRALAKAKERRQRQAEKVAEAKRRGKNTSFSAINIPLSGPRVEVILIWMAAVVLPDLEAANGLP